MPEQCAVLVCRLKKHGGLQEDGVNLLRGLKGQSSKCLAIALGSPRGSNLKRNILEKCKTKPGYPHRMETTSGNGENGPLGNICISKHTKIASTVREYEHQFTAKIL